MDAVTDCDFSSWGHFKTAWLEKVQEKRGAKFPLNVGGDDEGVVFRGMGCAGHSLISSFDRFLNDNSVQPEHSFELYREAICKYAASAIEVGALDLDYLVVNPDDPTGRVDESRFERAETYAQHHGFPTRLLDWSRSPYIAAFFAVSNSGLCCSGKVAIWCLDTKEVSQILSRDIKVLASRDHKNRRLISQRGFFTRNETNIQNMEELFLESRGRLFKSARFPVLIKMTIPVDDAREALSDLQFMGIDFTSVYPDLEGVKERTKYRVLRSAQ